MKKYKVGMYGGKFMPFHKGHLHCVKEASKQCEILYVLLFTAGDQEIRILNEMGNPEWLLPKNREEHMKKACETLPNVIVKTIDTTKCKKEDGSEDWEKETPLVLDACGKIDAVYGSELEYSDYYEKAYPGADYVIIDVERKAVHISGTMIRQMPEEERKKWIV